MKVLKKIIVEREFVESPPARLGVAVQSTGGWKFYPAIPHRQPSRHFYRSFQACLPAWTGFPNSCSSREIAVPDVVEIMENKAWNLRGELRHFPDGKYEVAISTIAPGAFDQLREPKPFASYEPARGFIQTVLGLTEPKK